MKLKDLKTGMRFITRNKSEYIVLKNVITPCTEKGAIDMYIDINGGWMASYNYKDDLTTKSGNKEFDIIEVYAQNNGEYINGAVLTKEALKYMDKIWERKEERQMTVSEIEKELGYSIKIVSED